MERREISGSTGRVAPQLPAVSWKIPLKFKRDFLVSHLGRDNQVEAILREVEHLVTGQTLYLETNMVGMMIPAQGRIIWHISETWKLDTGKHLMKINQLIAILFKLDCTAHARMRFKSECTMYMLNNSRHSCHIL